MSKPWGKVPSSTADDKDVIGRAATCALPITALSIPDFQMLTRLGAGSGDAGQRHQTARTHAYAWRNYRGVLSRIDPSLVALPADQSLSLVTLEAFARDLLARHSTAQAALLSFDGFAAACRAMKLDQSKAAFRMVRRDLAREAAGEDRAALLPAKIAAARTTLQARDAAALAAWRGRLDDGRDQVDVQAAFDASGYLFRALIGVVRRTRPELETAPDAVRFNRDAIGRFIDAIRNPGNPAGVLGRIGQLHFALKCILPDFDGTHILEAVAAERLKLIELGHLQPPPAQFAMAREEDLPRRALAYIDKCYADTPRNRMIARSRLDRQAAALISPQRRYVGHWKRELRPINRRIAVEAMRSWGGFLQRSHPERFSDIGLFILTPALIEEYVEALGPTCHPGTIADRLARLRRLLFRLGRSLDRLEWLARRVRKLRAIAPRRSIWRSPLRPRTIVRRALAAFEDAKAKLILLQEGSYRLCHPRVLAVRIRDCLLAALQALIFLRRKNLTDVRLRSSLKLVAGRFRLSFDGSEMKTGKVHRVAIPHQLQAALDHYITHVRSVLHPGFDQDALWISRRSGRALTASGLEKILPKIMLDLVGAPLSTHRFRNIGLTAAAELRSIDESLPMKLAGHTSDVVSERFYIGADLSDNAVARTARNEIDDIIAKVIASQEKAVTAI